METADVMFTTGAERHIVLAGKPFTELQPRDDGTIVTRLQAEALAIVTLLLQVHL
jgi:hypothetical protein